MEQIRCGLHGHHPESVVCGKITIRAIVSLEPLLQKREVQGFLVRHLEPVRVILAGHSGKSTDRIAGEVDSVELDVGQGVQQRGPSLERTKFSFRQLSWRDQFRKVGASGNFRRFVIHRL